MKKRRDPAEVVVMADMIFQSLFWKATRDDAVVLARKIQKVLKGKQ